MTQEKNLKMKRDELNQRKEESLVHSLNAIVYAILKKGTNSIKHFAFALHSVYATSSTLRLVLLSLTCSLCFLSPLEQLPHSSAGPPENRARIERRLASRSLQSVTALSKSHNNSDKKVEVLTTPRGGWGVEGVSPGSYPPQGKQKTRADLREG